MVQPHLLFISGVEIAFIFGADKIPEIARGLGKGIRQVKDATNDIKSEITKTADKQGLNLDSAKDLTDGFKQIKDDVEDFGGSIKRKL
jgi:sec-independent protein translocase protein TatA